MLDKLQVGGPPPYPARRPQADGHGVVALGRAAGSGSTQQRQGQQPPRAARVRPTGPLQDENQATDTKLQCAINRLTVRAPLL
jgi:hypothetical protein